VNRANEDRERSIVGLKIFRSRFYQSPKKVSLFSTRFPDRLFGKEKKVAKVAAFSEA
jgi:hypothetical protein